MLVKNKKKGDEIYQVTSVCQTTHCVHNTSHSHNVLHRRVRTWELRAYSHKSEIVDVKYNLHQEHRRE